MELADLFGEFRDFLTAPELAATIATVIVTALTLASLASSKIAYHSTFEKPETEATPRKRRRTSKASSASFPENFSELARDIRLDELTRLRLQCEKNAKWYSRSYNLLVFGQYIVGALLASSFIQESLYKSLTGFLGVLVLLSATIQQRYRPDVLELQEKARLAACNSLIRELEDGIFRISKRVPDAPTVAELRERATKGLTEFEKGRVAGSVDYEAARNIKVGAS